MVTFVTIVPAAEFKARCLALLDEVSESGCELVVTKRGRPVARIVPVEKPEPLQGSVIEHVSEAELIAPLDDAWDAGEA